MKFHSERQYVFLDESDDIYIYIDLHMKEMLKSSIFKFLFNMHD